MRPASMLLLLLVLIVYVQTVEFEFLQLDDTVFILENPHIRVGLSPEAVRWAFTAELTHESPRAEYWMPITLLSRILDVTLFGLNPAGHHFVNLALHAANVLLFFHLLAGATGAIAPSLFAAAIFAVHPIHAESIAWVTERKDVLSLFFGLLALHAWMRYYRNGSRIAYLGLVVAHALALMSKPSMVTIPIVMAIMSWWPLSRHRADASGCDRSGKWIALSLAIPLLLSIVDGIITLNAYAHSPLRSASLAVQITNALCSYSVYLARLAFPLNYACYYPFPAVAPNPLFVTVSVLLMAAFTIAAWRKRRSHPHRLTGFSWYVMTISPLVGSIHMANANRFTYLPMLGIYILVAWEIHAFTRGIWSSRIRITTAILIVLLAICGFRETSIWSNSITLFRRNISVTGGNILAHRNLALALADRGEYQAAHAELDIALKHFPDDVTLHFVRGILHARQQSFEQAEAAYKTALEIDPVNMHVLENYSNLRMRMGDPVGAAALYRRWKEIQNPTQRFSTNNH